MSLFASDSLVVNGALTVLVIFSIVTWSIVLIKLFTQWRECRDNKVFTLAFWAAKEWNAAAATSQTMRGSHAQLAQAGFAELREVQQHSGAMQHLGSPQDGLERSLRQAMQNLQRQFESGLAVLASIGSTAPFVGLFGTVWGLF